MKIRIEADEGEVQERAADVLRVIEEISGTCLHKATPREGEEQESRTEPLLPVLRELLHRGQARRSAIQARMLAKINAVLGSE